MPRWGDTDIRLLDEHALNDWIEDDYRVEDREATVANYGGQSRTKRQQVMKMPGVTTLGNLDHALLQAIDKSLGEDSEPRVFIDEASVRAVFRVMTDEWMAAGGHSADLRRMLRTYVAMISTTGIRAGLEAKRVRIGYVQIASRSSDYSWRTKDDVTLAPNCRFTASISPSTQSSVMRVRSVVKNAAPLQLISWPVAGTPKNSLLWMPLNRMRAATRVSLSIRLSMMHWKSANALRIERM